MHLQSEISLNIRLKMRGSIRKSRPKLRLERKEEYKLFPLSLLGIKGSSKGRYVSEYSRLMGLKAVERDVIAA